MATIKAYSVARTQKSYDPTTPTAASEVYPWDLVSLELPPLGGMVHMTTRPLKVW